MEDKLFTVLIQALADLDLALRGWLELP